MPAPIEDTLIGQPIGNYVLKSVLGVGGMGAVYLAEHPAIGRQVAIKVLAAELSLHARLSERFLSEARALALIENPNVIEIYDFGKLPDGRLFYVMEHLKGLELGKVMNQRGRLTAADVQPYLEQICRGLHATHEKGIIHRDLKPENIFVLDRDPMVIKLLDFGIAKLQHQGMGGVTLTQTGMVMGTPLYIAPEQASGEVQKIGPQTDLYSLGVIIYWMLSGKPPFFDETPALLLAKHISAEVPPIRSVFPSVPATVAQVVERCLEKAPEDRHATADELARRFAEAVDEAEAEVAAGEALIPGPADVKALTSMDGEPALEISTGAAPSSTGPGEDAPDPVDPDATVEQAAMDSAPPTSAMPAAVDGDSTLAAEEAAGDRVDLTMPVPIQDPSDLAATTPVPAEMGEGDAALTTPSQPGSFTPPPFEPAKPVGPSSTEITAELPEAQASIDAAAAKAAGKIEDPTKAHTQTRTTLRGGAGELLPGKPAATRTWILAGALVAALLVTGVVLLISREDKGVPAPPPTPAAARLPDQRVSPPDLSPPDQGVKTAAKKKRPAIRRPRPKKKPHKAGDKVFPDPFKAGEKEAAPEPQKRPRPATKKKPTPAPKKKPHKPKNIGEGTMEF